MRLRSSRTIARTMREDLQQLLPNIPLKEHRPAGFAANSAWDSLELKVCFGYGSRARRVWVDPEKSTPGLLVVSCEIETAHCNRDAESLLQAVYRNEEAIDVVRHLGVQMHDRVSSGETSFLWSSQGLSFRRLTFVQDRYIGEVSSVAFAGDASLDIEIANSMRRAITGRRKARVVCTLGAASAVVGNNGCMARSHRGVRGGDNCLCNRNSWTAIVRHQPCRDCLGGGLGNAAVVQATDEGTA